MCEVLRRESEATYDFAKKAANVAAENFSAVAGRNSYPEHP
jgi:hypothetical protein